MKPGCEVYKNEEGRIAVLVSPNGWSTYYYDKNIAFDKRIVEYLMTNGLGTKEKFLSFRDFFNSLGYKERCPVGETDYEEGWRLDLYFIKPGAYIRISDTGAYDIEEHIEIYGTAEEILSKYTLLE